MRRFAEPTVTSVSLNYLRGLSDFATTAQIALAVNKTKTQVNTALHSLQYFKAVDCVESQGRLWWFALPPESDTRTKTYDHRTPESKPRKRKIKETCK